MTSSEEGGSERGNFSRPPGPSGRVQIQTQKLLGAQGRLTWPFKWVVLYQRHPFPRHSFSSESCFRHSPLPLPQFLSAGGGNATLPQLFPPGYVCVEGHEPAQLRRERQAGLHNDALFPPLAATWEVALVFPEVPMVRADPGPRVGRGVEEWVFESSFLPVCTSFCK